MKIAILGGTGPEGAGLAMRWARAGHEVIIGSRQAEKGLQVAAELNTLLNSDTIRGADNLAAAQAADVVVLSVPYEAQLATLAGVAGALEGKLLITVVAPTRKPKARVWRLESGLSAAEEAQQQLGDPVRVVAAFQNIGAHNLKDPAAELDCDVLVCGENRDDKQVAIDLCADANMRGVDAGALQNAGVIEGLTSVLIAINIRHKVSNAGIRITGI